MTTLYNDNDPFCTAWLRNLIAAGLLPEGEVDDRDIRDLAPTDLAGIGTFHAFAGIGGWPYALRLAGWPDEWLVWTASLPCQPWSAAGRLGGMGDERHLWPAFRGLVAECKPAVLLGEQVASKAGRQWLAGVRADLEELGYAVGAADLPAASVGAPHIRQRLFWVANSNGSVSEQLEGEWARPNEAPGTRSCRQPNGPGKAGGVAESVSQQADTADTGRLHAQSGSRGGLDYAAGDGTGRPGAPQQSGDGAHDGVPRAAGAWDNSILIPCADGKARRISTEPGDEPLAYGVPDRVGRLRAYGNAIVAPLAAEFIKAFMETTHEAR